MKLQLEYQAADPVAIIELKKCGADINICINGEEVAYFYGSNDKTDKTHLTLMTLTNSAASQYVQLDKSGRIVVR